MPNTSAMSAWDVFATAHRDADVSYRFLVIDEAGEYRVDRLVPGNNWLYNHSNTRTISCTNIESRVLTP